MKRIGNPHIGISQSKLQYQHIKIFFFINGKIKKNSHEESFYFIKEFPVISSGFSIPNKSNTVGAKSYNAP